MWWMVMEIDCCMKKNNDNDSMVMGNSWRCVASM